MRLEGRRKIFVENKEYDDLSILEAWAYVSAIHKKNAFEINYLHKYLKGKQPILSRTKEVRPEICNKPVENHALEIQNFKVGFTFGEPVQYVLHGDCQLHNPEKKNDTRVASLNELMLADDKPSKDKRLGDWIMQSGVGYKMLLPTEKGSEFPFESYILDPRRAFVAISDDYKQEPVLCGYISKDKSKVSIYSKTHFWEIVNGKITVSKLNNLGELPIIQYQNNANMQGCFETVIDICDALNNIQANRLDGVEQFIQSFIWFHNCDIDKEQFEQLKANGGIKTKSPQGTQAQIKILSETLDQQQTQQLVDDLYQKMLTIAGVPDRKASAGGNTGQALIIGEGWVMAESSAKDFELDFAKPEKAFIKLALKICRNSSNCPPEIGDLSISDIDIKFTRNKTDNILTKTQALMNMLEAGVHPRVAFKICGLFNDPEQAYQDSIPYLEKYVNGEGDGSELIDNADNTDPVSAELLKVMTSIKNNIENEE